MHLDWMNSCLFFDKLTQNAKYGQELQVSHKVDKSYNSGGSKFGQFFPLHVLNNFKLTNFVNLSLKLIPNVTPGNSAISANHSRAEYSLYFKVQINILELSTWLFQSTF